MGPEQKTLFDTREYHIYADLFMPDKAQHLAESMVHSVVSIVPVDELTNGLLIETSGNEETKTV